MADKETIGFFKQFSKPNNKEDDVHFARLLVQNVGFSFLQRRRFQELISELSILNPETKQYINIKQEMITMAEKNLESTINNESIVNNSLWSKVKTVAQIGVVATLLYGASANLNKVHAQDSGVTTTQIEERDLKFYENLSLQMEALNAKNKTKKVIELGKQYVNDENNKSGYFLNELGCALKRNGNYKEAEEILLKGLNLDLNKESLKAHQDLLCNLGEVLYKTGRKREAMEACKKSYDLDPNSKTGENAKQWLNYIPFH